MSKIIKIRKGLNIKLQGKAEKIFIKTEMSDTYALKPIDFYGITPKLTVNVGDKVKAGEPLFYNKYNPDIVFTAPVSGEISGILRGDRRIIQEIVIKADNEIQYKKFKIDDPETLTRQSIIKKLLNAGLWPSIRQRPYSIIANPEDIPKSIFISAFDTGPMAPDYDFLVLDCEKNFQTGIDILSKLTNGKIHLNIDATYPPAKAFADAKGVQINRFKGPHPAGNVGIQIHHIDPINKGEIVWYVDPQDIITIGRLFEHGIYDASKIIALTGSEIIKPRYYKIINGCNIQSIIKDNIKEGDNRIISGNVLTGKKIQSSGYIGYYNNQITVIPEGNHFDFLGWALPSFKKYSTSRTFFSWLTPDKEHKIHTNLNGGKRAFVMTGQYEKVLPMNIYPMHLLKSILVEDIDLMEKLGIYEVAEEDFALCEFVCVSKTEIQEIIRKGLDLMRKEMS